MKNLFSKKKRPVKESPEVAQIQVPLSNKDKLIDDILIESEMRYRRLFESAKDGILILDYETGSITDANPFIVKMIGLTLDEIRGKKLWEIGLFSNKAESEQAFTELTANDYIRFEDMPVQRGDGKITEVEFISNVYLVNNSKVIQCNIRDITQRKQAETALKESERSLRMQNAEYQKLNYKYLTLNEELATSLHHIQKMNEELILAKAKAVESDNLKTVFLANMSHEIRTPMNAITGFSNMLLEPGLSEDQLKKYVQIINSSSQLLLTVIGDIIDMSKIEAGQITLKYSIVNVNVLFERLSAIYKTMVELKSLRLNVYADRPDDLIQITTDENRLTQVLNNIMNNALKFTSKGNIEFGYRVKENFIEFYVTDTGIGIAPGNQELIFQSFRQVEPTYDEINFGNGLGLSISKALVEKLGGTIKVQSAIGSGSTFSFTLPFTNDSEDIINAETSARMDGLMNWHEKTILIVEDEIYNHAYIEAMLVGTGVKMLHAWNGKEAVDQVNIHSGISLVLMDIKMPVMNGYEALDHIKQIRPELPVIAQTAYALSQHKAKALKAGFDSYISKPIQKNILVEMMAGYLDSSSVLQQ
ncbi:MAG: ATP-binding protein [Bacteroidales bacterium]